MYQKPYKIAVFFLLLILFFASIYSLMQIYSEYPKGQAEYKKLEEIAIVEESGTDSSADGSVLEIATKESFSIDFQALKEINKDIVAWIMFEEPQSINYPVVQGIDNTKYLKTTFNGEQNNAGTLFVDSENAGNFNEQNAFIYGHNMRDGSMFGQLREYKSKSFCEEYPYFYIYTADGRKITYQVFSVCIVDARSESYKKDFNNDEAFMEYVDYIRSIALYDTEVEVTTDSQIISLSTCTNTTEYERLLIHAVKNEEIFWN